MAKAKNTADSITADDMTDTVREAAPRPEVAGDEVIVTVTKFGDGQISTGRHDAGLGDVYAKRGEKITVSRRTAQGLEARGLAEID